MKEIRLLIAEYLLMIALRITPRGEERLRLAELLLNYFNGHFVLKK
jgi:hypothetical protein